MSTELAPEGERMWAVVAQLCPYVSTFIGPVILLLLLQNQPFARYHATQAIALQAAIWVSSFIIGVIASMTCGFGAVLYLALLPFALAPLWGAWKAFNGEWSGFPGVSNIGR